ncbi:hypothetical protein [Pontixanthobacter sp.]
MNIQREQSRKAKDLPENTDLVEDALPAAKQLSNADPQNRIFDVMI